MPYVPYADRERLRPPVLATIAALDPQKPGELTYVLARIAFGALDLENATYAERSRVLAALRDAENELRRTIMDPYERKKQEIHGAIWE